MLVLAPAAGGASLLTLSNPVADGAIITTAGNNDRGDWASATAYPADADESNTTDYAGITIAHDTSSFFLRQQTFRTDAGGFLTSSQKLFFDTDRSRATGYRGPGDTLAVGGEYMLEGATLYLYTGSGTDWGWSSVASLVYDDWPTNDHELTLSRSSLGNAASFDFIAITDFWGGGDAYADGAHGGAAGSYYTYTTVPEPAAALLGGIGLMALLRRRK